MRMFKAHDGFTLVELMVVVLIIGILVAVAIPVFNTASASARKRACQSNQRTLDGAVEQWAAANPANSKSQITDLTTAAAKLATPDMAGQGLTGEYVKDWAKSTTCPADPALRYSVLINGDNRKFSCTYAGTGSPHYY